MKKKKNLKFLLRQPVGIWFTGIFCEQQQADLIDTKPPLLVKYSTKFSCTQQGY